MTLRGGDGRRIGGDRAHGGAVPRADGPYAGRFTASPGALGGSSSCCCSRGRSRWCSRRSRGAWSGCSAAFLFEHPITGQLAASELCWWVDPEARGARARCDGRAGETWARGAGARVFEMIAPNERVGAFYERLGFERTDIHYPEGAGMTIPVFYLEDRGGRKRGARCGRRRRGSGSRRAA
jgi:hypothetical protein